MNANGPKPTSYARTSTAREPPWPATPPCSPPPAESQTSPPPSRNQPTNPPPPAQGQPPSWPNPRCLAQPKIVAESSLSIVTAGALSVTFVGMSDAHRTIRYMQPVGRHMMTTIAAAPESLAQHRTADLHRSGRSGGRYRIHPERRIRSRCSSDEVTFRDRGGRLWADPDGRQWAGLMTADRPGRLSSLRGALT